MRGLPVDEPKPTLPSTQKELSPQRKAVIPLLLRFLEKNALSMINERNFRATAVAAVAALCRMRNSRGGPSARGFRIAHASSEDVTNLSLVELDSLSRSICLPTQFGFCFWDEKLCPEAREKEYARSDALKRHLDRCHKQNPESPRECPECEEKCVNKLHLRRHGQDRHSIILANI